MRTLITTYYGPRKAVLKKTRGSRIEELLPNIMRHFTRNDYGATVAESIDEETGELLFVVSYRIGEKLQVVFERDVKRPVCVTDIPEDDE